jgi:hypothetical protein
VRWSSTPPFNFLADHHRRIWALKENHPQPETTHNLLLLLLLSASRLKQKQNKNPPTHPTPFPQKSSSPLRFQMLLLLSNKQNKTKKNTHTHKQTNKQTRLDQDEDKHHHLRQNNNKPCSHSRSHLFLLSSCHIPVLPSPPDLCDDETRWVIMASSVNVSSACVWVHMRTHMYLLTHLPTKHMCLPTYQAYEWVKERKRERERENKKPLMCVCFFFLAHLGKCPPPLPSSLLSHCKLVCFKTLVSNSFSYIQKERMREDGT